jgi:hypothetical protein
MLKIGELIIDEKGRIGFRRVASLDGGVANVDLRGYGDVSRSALWDHRNLPLPATSGRQHLC